MSALGPSAIRRQDSAVELEGVSKVFRRRLRPAGVSEAIRSLFRPCFEYIPALSDVSFSVRRGEIVAYAGPNGAGKSTTLRLISGLMSADTGRITVLGAGPTDNRIALMKKIGQRTELWWDHPVMASLLWKKAVWAIPDCIFNEMLDFAKQVFGLDELLEVPVRELSLGQRMRADLGFGLLHRPELGLLDEPTLGLDVDVKRRLIGGLRELNSEYGMTFLATSHDMDDMQSLADRILLLNRGTLTFDGRFSEMRAMVEPVSYIAFHATKEPRPTLLTFIRSDGLEHVYAFRNESNGAIAAAIADVEPYAVPGTLRVWEQSISDVVADLYRSWEVSASAELP